MSVFRTLLKRELGVCLGSFNGYVIVSAALLLVGVCFADLVYRLNSRPMDMTLTELFFRSWYFWLIMLLSAPLITMRSYANEKAMGTYETLLTAPVTDLQVLMSKFLGTLFFHAVIWLPVMFSLLVLRFYVDNPLVVSVPSVFTTYIGVLLVGALYMSIGCFGSALTRSQVVAGMVSFTMGMGVFMLSYGLLLVTPGNGSDVGSASDVAQLFSKFSLMDYMQDCARGILDTRPFVYILSMTFVFLFATYHLLQWRRWRG